MRKKLEAIDASDIAVLLYFARVLDDSILLRDLPTEGSPMHKKLQALLARIDGDDD